MLWRAALVRTQVSQLWVSHADDLRISSMGVSMEERNHMNNKERERESTGETKSRYFLPAGLTYACFHWGFFSHPNLMSFVLFNTPTSTHTSVRVSSAVCSSAKRKYIEEIFSSDSEDMGFWSCKASVFSRGVIPNVQRISCLIVHLSKTYVFLVLLYSKSFFLKELFNPLFVLYLTT